VQAAPLPATPLAGEREAALNPRRPLPLPLFVLLSAVLVLAVMALRAAVTYPTGVFDLYPLYYGAKAWLHSGNAYDILPVAPPEHAPFGLYQTGNIYPLPAVLLTLPLSFLSPQLAGTLWIGLLTAGLLIGLRLNRFPLYFLAYLPLVEGLRIEQVTAALLVLQLLALWAWREERWWLLATCLALIVAKPNQGLIFALALTILSRNWRRQAIVVAIIWGGSLLLDPNWFVEWLPALENHRLVQHQSIPWLLALFAIPLLLVRDYIGGAIMLQFLILPYPGIYASSAVPLSMLATRQSIWLIAAAIWWPIAAIFIGQLWATALTLLLPMVALSLWVRREDLLPRILTARRRLFPLRAT
jgi:hypothetical protein